MNARLLLLVACAFALPACDRASTVDAEERGRTEAEASRLARERAELAAERDRLESERARLGDAERRATDDRLAEIRERERVVEQRAPKATEAVAIQTAQRRDPEGESMDFFYEALQPHGDWIEVERYGFCWQPRVASQPDWRPYLDGRWTYTNYGWTWISNEPFGWATYHYGRWTRLRPLGWVWVPGSEWAPAWVSWRRSDRHVGWAPLPPEAHSGSGFTAAVDRYYDIGPGQYNFVAVNALDQPTYVGRIVEPERNVTLVRETRNVTNIRYGSVENRTVIINEGPDFDELSRYSHIRRTRIERVSEARTPMHQTGDVIQMLAPFIAAAARPQGAPAHVRERVRGAEIERGWSGTNAEAVQAARRQLDDEARRSEEVQRSAVAAPATPRPSRSRELPPPLPAARATPAPASTPPAGEPAPRRNASTPSPSKSTPAPAVTPATPLPAERVKKPEAPTATPPAPDKNGRERRPRSEKPSTAAPAPTPSQTPRATPSTKPAEPQSEAPPAPPTRDEGRRRPRNRQSGATATPTEVAPREPAAPSTPPVRESSDRPGRGQRERPESSERPKASEPAERTKPKDRAERPTENPDAATPSPRKSTPEPDAPPKKE